MQHVRAERRTLRKSFFQEQNESKFFFLTLRGHNIFGLSYKVVKVSEGGDTPLLYRSDLHVEWCNIVKEARYVAPGHILPN